MSMRSSFWLGDFLQILNENNNFDLLFACGILYHLQDPIGFLFIDLPKIFLKL